MSIPLLTTKLYMPPIRPELVQRPRLIEHLNEGLHRKLVLICAPAGFGKTTLVSAWTKDCGVATAWISLDESDNDPARFLAYLVAALRTINKDIGKGTLSALGSPQPPGQEAILTELINDINTLPNSLILVLDDYHLITAKPIHDAVTFLLEHLPLRMHLAIATRADPPLPIARLRGRGQLTELRQTDLRFSLDEATTFLNQVMGLGLSPDDITALTSRTEGWITGLQMAALALQAALAAYGQDIEQPASFVQAFTGTNRFVLDYLVEEVLQRQPELVQNFLLQTAVLDRLTGPLCDAVLEVQDTGWLPDRGEGQSLPPAVQVPISNLRSSSQQLLSQLEAANLFIIPLDNERRWYRYHRLFSDLLRKRLRYLQPEQEPILHSRASAWYEQNGLLAEAIDHALSAQDFERAADLIEQVAEDTLMRSEIPTFTGWVEQLPDELIRARPSLCLSHAWALLWSGQPLETIEARLQDLDMESGANAIRSIPVRAFLATWQGRVSRARDLTREALEQLPEDESFLRSIAAWNLGMSYMLSGDLQAGTQIFDQAISTAQQSGNVMIAVSALCHLAELNMSQANLSEAENLYQQALPLATDERGQLRPIAGLALIGLGELARERNDLEVANRHLLEGIEQIRQWGEFGALDGYLALARLRQAQGDKAGARDLLRKAEQIAIQFDVTEFDDLLVAMYQVRLWLAQGNIDAAIRWLADRGYSLRKAQDPSLSRALSSLENRDEGAKTDAGLPVGGEEGGFLGHQLRRYESILLARTLLHLDRTSEALPLLEAHAAMLGRQGRGHSRRMIEVQMLKALALQAQGSLDQALASLEAALAIAEPGGFVRMLVDEGEPMRQLLRQAATRGIAPEYTSKLVAAFEQPPHDAPMATSAVPHRQPPLVQPLVEPLSERELEVLRLLATGLSNPEIAQRLYIATSTVRSHLKNIYGKLNVHKRWDAVHRAEELGLL
jgi:LuxR family maltose regulon positive regulatory protein